ncbi:MAG: hypothetical protein ACYC6C_00995 [Coriobacteriia bacterium]
MESSSFRGIAALLLIITLLAAAASAAGVFLRGDGAISSAVSIRGEEYAYVTDGIYAFNAERIVAEGVGWDAVTLFAVVPALLLCVVPVARGSLVGRLAAVGLLGYVVYQYLMYAVFWALGPLFPLFVLLYPLAGAAIVWIVSGLDIGGLPAQFTERFPRRGMAVFSMLMGLALILMWSSRIAIGLSGDMAGAMMFGMPTLSVQALDLGVIVPLAFLTGVTALRRHVWSYLLVPVFAVKGVTMSAAVFAMVISAWMVEGALDVGPAVMFGLATLFAAWLCWLVLRSVRTEAVAA